MSDISFEHFDPELELGNLDENGRPIRPRKKPGRKPNPPSPAQRKAQNRAAQRAFRERKRREMREAESTVKRCIYARDQALGEVRRLKRRLEQLQFETNYLKGYALTLKMACVANQVEVPKFWDTGVTDEIGSEELTFSKTKGVPQQLEVFLDKKMNIISIDQHVSSLHHLQNESNTMSDNDLPPSSILSCSSPTSSYLVDEERAAQSPLSSSSSSSCSSSSGAASPGASSFVSDFENASQAHSQNSSNANNNDFDINDTLSSIAPQLASHLETPFFQQLLNTDLVGTHLQQPCTTHHASSPSPSSNNFPTTTEQQQINMSSPNPSDALDQQQQPVEEEEKVIDAKTGLIRSVTEYVDTLDADDSFSSSSSSASSVHSGDKKIFPPMTPLDAIHQMRAVKNLNSTTRALFTPTELQRIIPHDTRIDVVPGAALRDHMILFQDFYNANDLFDYLAESSVFLGGELGNPDSWFVPPNFFKRYWFLCPNHKHKRMDNAVEIMVKLGKKMIDLMAQRKQMYIERDQYADYFPEPSKEQVEQVQQVVDDEFLHRDDQQHLDDMYQQQQQQCMEMFAMEEDDDEDMLDQNASSSAAAAAAQQQHGQLNLLDSALPLDQFMTMINNATMPRLAPHSFTV
ncbi:unnamed protein product [Mucor circinelloides]